jgi:riboflavin synthase alpha subunit
MFTGLIAEVGTIEERELAGEAVNFAIRTTLGQRLSEGDSLAVNGACLTVTAFFPDGVRATAIAETLGVTTLGELRRGDRVNLEPALRAGDPLGGHIVQGHVDGIGRVQRLQQRGVSRELSVAAEPAVLRYVARKGSITIDGVSLTVTDLHDDGFTVALVPHTLGHTQLPERRAGDRVNLEVDILAKYVERLLGVGPGGGGLTEDWLREHGFA